MDFQFKDKYAPEDLLKIMEILCDKDIGCEWDRVQNHKSIRQNFIEETYEAVDAIDKDDKELMKEELGDVLLQVIYHCYFEQQQGNFDFYDVVDGVSQKLVMRHPHIFKNDKFKNEDGSFKGWEEIKNESHGHTTISRRVNRVPITFPALMYAQKVQKRVAAGGVQLPNSKAEIGAIRKILDEAESKIDSGESIDKDAVGALLFSAASLARQEKVDREEALSLYNKDFVALFNNIENFSLQNHINFDTMDFATLKSLWQSENRSAKDESK